MKFIKSAPHIPVKNANFLRLAASAIDVLSYIKDDVSTEGVWAY